ncbi:MAG: alpha/beta fold hydrolase [Ktedonobacterales bacterium]
MTEIKTATLRVPGASLYYQVRGFGPILLLIAGGAGDADSFNHFAGHLVGRYTVVTYDRRGYARSPLDDPAQPIAIETHSDDVHRLLAALGSAPPNVLGFSIGALIGLDLAIRHPEQVRTIVAHEPPVWQLLASAERPTESLHELYRKEGGAAALKTFAAIIGVDTGNPESNIGLPQGSARIADANREAFFKHDAGAVGRYTLDIAALQAAPTRVVLAGGRDGRAYFPYQCAARLAHCLGTTLIEFPGNHAGFVTHPSEFAERLREVLGNRAAG